MPPKVLIFDFDGTIANTLDMAVSVINLLSTQFNYKRIEPHELDRLRSMPARNVIQYLQIPLMKLPLVVAKGRRVMRSKAELVEPVQGLPEVLRYLRSKHSNLGILTTNSREFVNDFLERNNLQFFDFIYASSSIWGKGKRLNSYMSNSDSSRNDVIYIGDETRDIDAARKTGVPVVAVTWGYNSEKALQQCEPDYVVNHPSELLGVLDGEHSRQHEDASLDVTKHKA